MNAAPMRHVSVLRTLAEADALAPAWRALEGATPEATGFQSYDWCRAWMRASPAGLDCWRIVAVHDDGRLVALAPLERVRVAGIRLVRWLGEPLTQYGDALVANDGSRAANLADVWREIAGWRDVDLVKLGHVRADAALATLPTVARSSDNLDSAPFIDLRATAAARPDKNLRARRRKLEAAGPVSFDIVTDTAERATCVTQAIAWKRAWLEGRGHISSGLFHPQTRPAFAALADSETLVIGRLQVAGETVALELGLRANDQFRSLLGCHDSTYAYGSPGHLLIAQMVAWCREAGFARYDLMFPADAYKRRWAGAEVSVADHLHPLTARGQALVAWFRVRPALKALFARMPQRARQMLAARFAGGDVIPSDYPASRRRPADQCASARRAARRPA